MWSLPKNILTALLCVTLALPSPAVQADILEDGMVSLIESAATAINEPGQYRSQSRNVFIAGGLDMRFPRRSMPALVSVTPVNLRFGCGGISAHFGGFSFINGDEIRNLIQAIAQNALGMAIELVITTLCGQCAHVMQVLRTLAKDAAKLSIDSCAVAQGLMQEFTSYEPGMWTKAQSTADSSRWGAFCSDKLAETGAESDWFAAASNACNSAVDALEKFQERASEQIAGKAENPEHEAKLICKAEAGACNVIWNVLTSSGLKGMSTEQIASRLILMNIAGTTVRRKVADLEPGPDGKKPDPDLHYAPKLAIASEQKEGSDMDDVFSLFLCGIGINEELAQMSRSYSAYCSKDAMTEAGVLQKKSVDKLPVWDCAGEDMGKYILCNEIESGPDGKGVLIESVPVLLDSEGYIPLVHNILQSGLTSIRDNNNLSPDVIGLINISPVPIYQALNISAVYPEAAYDLIDTMTAVIAQMMVYRHVGDILRSASQFSDVGLLDQSQINNMFMFLGRVKAASVHRQAMVAQNLVLQEQLIQQIRALNQAMQKQVLTDELLGAQQFGSTLNTAVRTGP
jgi:conjugative transfer pilus assembly protein TraH